MTQRITLTSREMAMVRGGMKSVLVGKGKRQVTLGPLYLENEDTGKLWGVDVISVDHQKFKDVDIEDVRSSGFSDHDDMLKVMRETYPSLKKDSLVTIVRWN